MQPLRGTFENSTHAIYFSLNKVVNYSTVFQNHEFNWIDHSSDKGCSNDKEVWYSSFFGVTLAIPEWEAVFTAFILSIIIVLTIVGNILVILSVFTYKPLRIVQNFFIVSLAVADLTVALLVLPFNVAYSILGRWEFGIHLCKMWLTCDVMCCTSSILHLCVIALDRFWAITDPINYAYKRTVNRVLFLISAVWILSFIISSPPLFGWNDWPEEFLSTTPCELTSNRGYVIYSSLGSFFIPLIIMTMVYIEIYIAAKRRLRERGLTSKMYTTSQKKNYLDSNHDNLRTREEPDSPSLFKNLICCLDNSIISKFHFQNDTFSASSDIHLKPQRQEILFPQSSKVSKQIKIKDPLKGTNEDHIYIALESYPVTSSAETELEGSEQHTYKKTKTNHQILDEQKIIERSTTAQNSVKNGKSTNFQPSTQLSDTTIPIEKNSVRVKQFIEEKQKISLSKERRAARTLGIIMGVFVICWLPFFLMYVILPFCKMCCPTQKLKNFVTWLGYINSSFNPIIYTIFNLDFRRSFKTLLNIK